MIDGAAANILDFGGDPTGVASSTAALNAALATGNSVFIPKGTFRLTGESVMSNSGAKIFGLGPGTSKFLCDSAVHNGVFVKMAGGNNFIQDVSFEGNSTLAGNAIYLSNVDPYSFTGWMTIQNVNVTGVSLGVRINNLFAVLFDNCRFFGNNRGVLIDPQYDGIGDNGYFTTVTFNKCYLNQNSDYGLKVIPTLESKNFMLRDSVIESNAGSTSGYQSYVANCSPFDIENCYFEAESSIPFMSVVSSNTYIYGAYVNGTGGLALGSGTNYLTAFSFIGTSATDKVTASGTILQRVEFWDSRLGSDTSINATSQIYRRTSVGATFYNNRFFGIGLQLADNSGVTNTSYQKEVFLYKTTVSTTVPANGSALLITDEYLPNTWNADFAIGHAQIVSSYQPNIICQVTTATTGSDQYYCVVAHNLSASPIILTNAKLKIIFVKGDAMSV